MGNQEQQPASKLTPESLKQMRFLDIDAKIELSKSKIKEWYDYWDGEVYVCFSGGKDSTVLLHLVRSLYPDVSAAFTDTGLEYPEIRNLVENTDNVIWLKPKLNFREVIEKYGYPVVSKRISGYVYDVRHARRNSNTRRLRLEGLRKDGSFSPLSKISNKWRRLIGAPFKISNKCCHYLKMAPTLEFEKKTKLKPFLGIIAFEGKNREAMYFEHGCNAFDLTRPRSTPLAFWSDTDIWEYIRHFNVPYCPVYDMGYQRTGCTFCMYGVHLEKGDNRFQLMKKTHPKLHKYCIENLGLGKVLDFIRVPYEPACEKPEKGE